MTDHKINAWKSKEEKCVISFVISEISENSNYFTGLIQIQIQKLFLDFISNLFNFIFLKTERGAIRAL